MTVNICISTLRASKLKSTKMNLTVLCPEQTGILGLAQKAYMGHKARRAMIAALGRLSTRAWLRQCNYCLNWFERDLSQLKA